MGGEGCSLSLILNKYLIVVAQNDFYSFVTLFHFRTKNQQQNVLLFKKCSNSTVPENSDKCCNQIIYFLESKNNYEILMQLASVK
jgi:hypothetical protein